MKRFLISLVALSSIGLGCAPERTDLVIQGAITPKTDPVTGCTWSAGDAKTTEIFGLLNVDAQKAVNKDQRLSSLYGFQIQNTVASPPSQTPPGNSSVSPTRDDAVIKAFEIVATDDQGQTLAIETVTATGYVPHGSANVAVCDIVGKPLADALDKPDAGDFTMHLAIKAKGSFVGNGDFETGAYDFPVKVIYGSLPFTPPDGGAQILPPGTSSCE
jgi:hypothetical protein